MRIGELRKLMAITVVLGFAMTACSSPTTTPPEATAPDAKPSLTSAIESIAPQVQALMTESGVPGVAVAVVHDGKIEYAQGFGIANLDNGAKVDADTVFQLASVSKPVGATVIAQQVGDGILKWDDPIQESLPNFALHDPWVSKNLSVGDLYSHRSGLPDHAGDDLEWLGYGRTQILDRLRYLPLQPFRANYAYTNYGIMTGAVATAAAAGQEWSALSKKVLYQPLGMNRTTSSFQEYQATPNHAVGHEKVDGKWRVTPEQFDDDAATAAGGVASSVNDMAKWESMVLADGKSGATQVIKSEALVQALLPHNLSTPVPSSVDKAPGQHGYGMGIAVNGLGHTLLNHSGAFSQGAATFIGMIPASKLGVVVLTNGYPMGVAETVGMTFLDTAEFGHSSADWWSIYSAAFANVRQEVGTLTSASPPGSAAPSKPLSQYAGTYANPYFGDALITEQDGHLTLAMGPRGQRRWQLNHWDADTFAFTIGLPEVTEDSVSAVTFDPRHKSMVIEFYNDNGLGTFSRAQ